MADSLIAPSFLFRYRVPCYPTTSAWSAQGIELGDEHVLPCFEAELGGRTPFAEVRVGWNDAGLYLQATVRGKQSTPWCRESRLEESDGLRVWIDTRDTHNVHRASRFCHQFVLLPQGEGAKYERPVIELLNIHRAKSNPEQPPRGALKITSQSTSNGYQLQGFIPADAITGFDSNEHRRLGFFYAVMDRELGWQTFAGGADFPFQTDPSMWGTLELTD